MGYDVYDLYDLGEFDQKGSVRTKYGTRQEYIDAINAVHASGMRVMVDIVLNQKAGGDEKEKMKVVKVDPSNRNKAISAPLEIEAFTIFTLLGRQKKYSEFEWNFMCFFGVDYVANLKEALSLGTETIIMNNEKILQKDKPEVIIKQPVDGLVREFISTA